MTIGSDRESIRVEAGHGTPTISPTIIRPERAAADWLELWDFRDLLLILAQRDIKLRYRQTILGVIWVVLQPLTAAAIFAWIFGSLAGLPSEGIPYVLFVLAAMLPWTLFSGGLQRAANSLISDARLITKVYFPRAIIPIASTAGVLVDFAVVSILVLISISFYGTGLQWSLLSLPLLIVLVFAVTVGLSLLFSALSVYYRDFAYVLPFLLQLWLYASPVVYSTELIPEQWRFAYGLNPLVGIIDGFRWALFGGTLPLTAIVEATVVAALLVMLGTTVFQRVERSFADVI